jgi:hypothetical protein
MVAHNTFPKVGLKLKRLYEYRDKKNPLAIVWGEGMQEECRREMQGGGGTRKEVNCMWGVHVKRLNACGGYM